MPINPHTTRAAGTILTAALYNLDHVNHVTNAEGLLDVTISAAGLATGGGDLNANRTITVTEASLAEAQAGTATTVALTPRRGLDLLTQLGLLKSLNTTVTNGIRATSFDAGTKSTGTFTPDMLSGNVQHAINNGAHTLAPPTGDGTMVIRYTNGASAGAITTSGFDKVDGATLTTTNGQVFVAFITVIGTLQLLTWKAGQ